LLDAQERRIAVLGELPPQQHATLADAHTQRLRALAELEPERGSEWIAELEALPERYELDEDWERQLVRELARLRYRMAQQALVEGEALRSRAESLLDAILDSVRGNERVHELVTLGRSFESIELGDLSRRAFDQAATEILRRLAEAAAAKDDLPELQGATEEDWQIHEESQQRLFAEQRELMDTVAELWRPGHPAFELIVVDDLVRLCAWCRRLQRRDGEWIPASGYVPSTPAVSVSHGICEGCREAHFNAVGG